MKKYGLRKVIALTLAMALCIGLLPAALAVNSVTLTKDNAKLIGSAYYDATNDLFVLTEESYNKNGSVWLDQVNCNGDFTLSLEFYTGHEERENGADGICVAFYADSNAKTSGLGYQGCGGYAVEIDTYQNGYDPAYNHIAMIQNDISKHLQVADATAFTEDGKWHRLRIATRNQVCTVFVDGAQMLEMDGIAADKKYNFGFTAGTGGSCNYQAVRNVVLDEAVWQEPEPVKGTFNGHEYAVYNKGITWAQAKSACEDAGGHLVTIGSQEEQDFVWSLIKDNEKEGYWIGLSDTETEGTWKWVTDEPVKYTHWGSTQPDDQRSNGGEDFVGISRLNKSWANASYWNDFNEDGVDIGISGFGYICEWGVDDPEPEPEPEKKPEPEPEPEPQKPASKDTTSFGSHVSEWAADEMEKAYEMKLIPEKLVGEDLTRQINRAEFAAVAVKTFESLSGGKAVPIINNPFTDCNDTEVLKAYSIGAVKGISDTQFSPNALLNREQAAAMLTRVFKRITIAGWTLDTDSQFTLPYTKPTAFADDRDISGWAKDSVYFMVANQIISGTGNNKFAPKNTTTAQEAQGYANATREQALAIAVRMVENLGD